MSFPGPLLVRHVVLVSVRTERGFGSGDHPWPWGTGWPVRFRLTRVLAPRDPGKAVTGSEAGRAGLDGAGKNMGAQTPRCSRHVHSETCSNKPVVGSTAGTILIFGEG